MTIIPLYERKRFRESWSGLVSAKAELYQKHGFEPTLKMLGDWAISQAEDVSQYLHEKNNRAYDDQAYHTLDILDEVYNIEKVGLCGAIFPLAIGIKKDGSPVFGWLRSQKSSLNCANGKIFIQEGEGGATTIVSEFDHVIRDATPSILAHAWRAYNLGQGLPVAMIPEQKRKELEVFLTETGRIYLLTLIK